MKNVVLFFTFLESKVVLIESSDSCILQNVKHHLEQNGIHVFV